MIPAQNYFLYLNVTDYVIVSVIAVSTLISLVRGFLKESVSLCIWILGFWLAIKYNYWLMAILQPYITSEPIRKITSFVGIFLLILILGSIFNHLLSLIVVKSGLSGTDRLLGMVFGGARGVLLVTVVLLLIASTSFVRDEWWKKSVLIPHFQTPIEWLRVFLPKQITTITEVVK